MGMTIIEKIFSNHSDEKAVPGNIIWIDIDVRTARDFGGANVIKNLRENYSSDYIEDLSKTCFTFDTNAPAKDIGYATNQHIIRKFSRDENVQVYDVDKGIGSHLMMELGFAYPGVTAVGTDSHYNILGAIGAFGQGMGDKDIAYIFKSGRTWFEVPHTIKITLKGQYNYPVTAKDIVLFLIGKLGSAGALGKVVELYGDCIDKMTLHERITVASMGTEMGAISIIIPPNDEVMEYCSKRSGKTVENIAADSDAVYTEELEFDISQITPQIAKPFSPDNVVPVSETAGVKIDSVFVGSCTNGRIEDIEIAADILKGKKVHERVMFKIVPATREVYGEMLKKGLVEQLYDSGVIVSNPGCGGCAKGQIGMTGPGEIQLSTSNRNFQGKQGKGNTYLVGPAVAAYSALYGEIREPEVK